MSALAKKLPVASTWFEVGALDAIPRLGSRVVQVPSGDIAVFRGSDDSVFAVDDRCPHRGGPLSQGIVHGGRVTCPLHAWKIELATGDAVAPDVGCVRRHEAKVEQGTVYLRVATEVAT